MVQWSMLLCLKVSKNKKEKKNRTKILHCLRLHGFLVALKVKVCWVFSVEKVGFTKRLFCFFVAFSKLA